ncbi:ATPase [Endozoicomonas sp. (ex Bugula neritina AB1)]|nr:ATPase [Endozoicomonas sp. (ex Bugula neritina AB1)]
MTPEVRYQQDLSRRSFSHDSAQAVAVRHLQDLYDRLCSPPSPSIKETFRAMIGQQPPPTRGLYFWGGVGRGKTYLMDTFYQCLPFDKKLRMHFHHFMRKIHQELNSLEGQKDPLKIVADRITRETRIICFDEFFVSDITDAMILGSLFEELFRRGVCLVATSNVEPKNLYQNGLQRARFLPAIDMIYQHTEVLNIDGGVDYRLRLLEQANMYFYPLGSETNARLTHTFLSLAPNETQTEKELLLEINNRPIQSIRVCEDIAWFHFDELCDGPRSQNDYIELARIYQTILLESIPKLDEDRDDQTRRFISLVDEFYDRGVKLILSSNTPLLDLYTNGKLSFEFQRTLSRLQEMQSREYLAQSHQTA